MCACVATLVSEAGGSFFEEMALADKQNERPLDQSTG